MELTEVKRRKRDMEADEMKQKIKKIGWDELPYGIVELIFSKLVLSELMICRQICKSWTNLISTCKFYSPRNLFFALISHVCRTLHCVQFEPPKPRQNLRGGRSMNIVGSFSPSPTYSPAYFEIVNSCRGLLLCCFVLAGPISFSTADRTRYVILNPITNQYLNLPTTVNCHRKNYQYGFGFCPTTREFKIARVSHELGSESLTLLEILAFGTTMTPCWTRIRSLPLPINTNAAYFNGALYWVVTQINHSQQSQEYQHTYVICRLDLKDYNLDQFTLGLGSTGCCLWRSFHFGVLNQAFYLTLNVGADEYRVWKMMEPGFSWVQVFVVRSNLRLWFTSRLDLRRRSYHLQLIQVCKDDDDHGKILCLLAGRILLLYDPYSDTTQILTDPYVPIMPHSEVYPIDYFHFDSLARILARDA